MERVAEQAGAVIHNSIVFEQTQEDSLTDPLTSLPNRRSMFVHLTRELARAERLKNEVALIVMDVDEFKAINDNYGHHVGDRALREVAIALQNGLRSYDLCVRYAGDEFIVVLADCTRDAAEVKRRELQQRVAEIELEVRPGKMLRLGASAGAAVFPLRRIHRTRRCWPTPISGCIETSRPAAASSSSRGGVEFVAADVFDHASALRAISDAS